MIAAPPPAVVATASQPASSSVELLRHGVITLLNTPKPRQHARNVWVWDGLRGDVSSLNVPLGYKPAAFQFLWSAFNQPTPVSGSLGNSFWLRFADEGLRFEEVGTEGSLTYPDHIFHGWRVMLGHHQAIARLPWIGDRLAPFVSPEDHLFLYGGMIRASDFWHDTGSNNVEVTSDAGIGAVFAAGGEITRGDWTFQGTFNDLGFVNWNQPNGLPSNPTSYTQHLNPRLVAQEHWIKHRWRVTQEEVVSHAYDAAWSTGWAGQYRVIGGYQWFPWLAPRLSIGYDTQSNVQYGAGFALTAGSYLLNIGLTYAQWAPVPIMVGIQTGTAW
jgi:hypothetical protein